MADYQKFVQSQAFTLAGAGASIGDTSLVLSSFTDPDGNLLSMNDFGNKGFGTLEPNNGSFEEQISFSGVVQNVNGTATLTGVKSVLFKTPYTESSGLAKAHAGGVYFVISNTAGFYNELASTDNDETISGDWTFSNYSPTIPTEISSEIHRAASIEYVNSIVIAGAPVMSTTVIGIAKMTVNPAVATNPIVIGDLDPRVPTQGENDALVGNNTDIAVGTGNKFVTQTGLIHGAEIFAVDSSSSSTAYLAAVSPIPTSLTNGMVVRVKIGLSNTTTTPTLDVNSLGAKTIVKGVTTALSIGDIGAGQYCTFIYDTTNTVWVLQNPTVGVNSYSSALTTVSSVATDQTIDTTLTTTFLPKVIYVNYSISGHTGAAQTTSQGVLIYDGTTLRVNNAFISNNTSTLTPLFTAVAPFAGSNNGSDIKVTLSLFSVSATSIVIRSVFAYAGGISRTGTANFVVNATN